MGGLVNSLAAGPRTRDLTGWTPRLEDAVDLCCSSPIHKTERALILAKKGTGFPRQSMGRAVLAVWFPAVVAVVAILPGTILPPAAAASTAAAAAPKGTTPTTVAGDGSGTSANPVAGASDAVRRTAPPLRQPLLLPAAKRITSRTATQGTAATRQAPAAISGSGKRRAPRLFLNESAVTAPATLPPAVGGSSGAAANQQTAEAAVPPRDVSSGALQRAVGSGTGGALGNGTSSLPNGALVGGSSTAAGNGTDTAGTEAGGLGLQEVAGGTAAEQAVRVVQRPKKKLGLLQRGAFGGWENNRLDDCEYVVCLQHGA
jgi:hypothetical protein